MQRNACCTTQVANSASSFLQAGKCLSRMSYRLQDAKPDSYSLHENSLTCDAVLGLTTTNIVASTGRTSLSRQRRSPLRSGRSGGHSPESQPRTSHAKKLKWLLPSNMPR
ncbi:hypothetical protein V7S43_013619 [Phytophthora oleae]|uniref:Uncharacterized protein n=1 Tax=Phytophthora oleae TaxID=2107226 RepID=A0ABD3F4H5_9STRA